MNTFQIAQEAGNRNAIRTGRAMDFSAIDEILKKAEASKNPADVRNAMSQILTRVSPENQQNALALLQSRYKELQQQRSGAEVEAFADKLEKDNPNSNLHKAIADVYRLNIPIEQKSKLIKDLNEIDLFKKGQQDRLMLESKRKIYDSAIKDLTEELKSARYSEKQDIQKRLDELRKERDNVLGIGQNQTDRPAFDKGNPEHKARAQELYEQLKDKENVREQLSQEFSGL
ncbi:MAG: hypothetical protein Q8O94_03545 [bacterium]|nr:hypothetical protein [bacterium]